MQPSPTSPTSSSPITLRFMFTSSIRNWVGCGRVKWCGVVSAVIDKSRQGSFDEDLVLVERFLSGDARAFEELYSKYYEKVFAIARGVLMDADEAADAVQEVFTLVYRHLARFDKRSRFSTWLFRVAVNRSIQEARRNRYRSRTVALTEAAGKVAPE